MKILQLTTRMKTGGIATYVATLSEGLMMRGHDVRVAAHPDGAEHLLASAAIPFIPLDVETKFAWHPKLKAAEHFLADYIRRERIDLIHAHTRVTQALACRLGRRTGVPVVSTCHGFYRRNIGRLLFPAWGDYVVAISGEVKRHLVETFRIPEARIRVVLNAVRTDDLIRRYEQVNRDAARAKWGFQKNDFVLGMTARVEKVKGHAYLIHALAELREAHPTFKLLIAGTGSEMNRLKKLADQKKVADRVVFTGELPHVAEALKSMDLFISPHTWEEGFGLSIAEAMACGVPVIASETGALREIIRHEETGYLVKPARTDALREAITRVSADVRLRERLASKAKVYAAEHFSAARFSGEIEQVYFNVGSKGATHRLTLPLARAV